MRRASSRRPSTPVPIVLVTLSPDVVGAVRGALGQGWEVVAVRSYFRVIDLLVSRPFAALIADTAFQGGTQVGLLEAVAHRDDIEHKPLRVMLHHDGSGLEPPRPDLAPCEAVTRFPSGLEALGAVLRALLKQRGVDTTSPRRAPVSRPVTTPEADERPTVRRLAAQPVDPSTVIHLAVDTSVDTDDELADLPELEAEPLDVDDVGLMTVDDELMTVDEGLGLDDEDDVSGTRPLAVAAPAASGLLARTSSFQAFVAEVDRRYAALERQDYHQILDVPEDADADLLQRVFDAASLRFHPDRNRGIADSDLCHRISELYAAITEAYDVLSSPAHRERWQRARHSGEHRVRDALDHRELRLTELSRNPGAQRFLRLAERARDDGDQRSALMNLRFALDLDPDNAQLDAKVRQWQDPGS